ncbi:MAG: sigma-E processing peptidase SpoIIGA [Bacillota bacterium]
MSGTYPIRLDMLFLINLLIDFCLFWFAGMLSWTRPRWWRVLAAAVLGASLTFLPVLVPWGGWFLSSVGVIVVGILLVAVMVWPCSPIQFGAVYGLMWVGLVLTGGTVRFLTERIGSPMSFVYLTLIAGGVAAALMGAPFLWQGYGERKTVRDGLHQVRIRLGEQSLVLTGFVDSGNSLSTPVTRRPVAVVEAERLRPYLPPEVMEALSMGWYALEALPEAWRNRCQLVPYSAVGNQGGALLVITPDELALWERRAGRWVAVGGLIGLAMQPLGPQGHYQALLSPGMLREAQGKL